MHLNLDAGRLITNLLVSNCILGSVLRCNWWNFVLISRRISSALSIFNFALYKRFICFQLLTLKAVYPLASILCLFGKFR
jgi:hypothetical protein